MPANNPEKLTVQQLIHELRKKKVTIPTQAKKDTYVQLYRKYILKTDRGLGFSSDEEEGENERSSRSTKKVTVRKSQVYHYQTSTPTRSPPPRKGAYKIIFQDKLSDVEDLTDWKLRSELERRGVQAGPVVATTRPVYERKLAELLVQEIDGGQRTKSQSTMVSFHDDNDDEEEEDEEEEDEEKEEDEEEFSDSDLEEEKPRLHGSGDSRLHKRSTHQQKTSTSRQSTVYRSSTTTTNKSTSQDDAKQQGYCCGLHRKMWLLVIIAGIVGFIYCVWLSLEESKMSISTAIPTSPKEQLQ